MSRIDSRSISCQCLKVVSSMKPKRSLCTSCSADDVSRSWRPRMSPIRRTHGIRSSRLFHTSATWPPGLSTRAISGSAHLVVEPVERLRDHHHVDGAVVGGDLLGGRDLGAHLGHPLAQHLQHRLVGLGGEDGVALVDELAGQLAGARGELEDDLGLPAGEPRGRLGGVARTTPVVRLGDGAEGPRAVDGGGGLGEFVAHPPHRIGRQILRSQPRRFSPWHTSRPEPPSSVSRPAPPISRSLPGPPKIMSLPRPPLT